MNQNDPNWWQARKVGNNGPAGLIPSQELEERRKAFVEPDKDYVHKIGICGTRVSSHDNVYCVMSGFFFCSHCQLYYDILWYFLHFNSAKVFLTETILLLLLFNAVISQMLSSNYCPLLPLPYHFLI